MSPLEWAWQIRRWSFGPRAVPDKISQLVFPVMAQLKDLKLTHRLFVENYPFRTVDWPPGTCLAKPLSQSKLALITSAGVYLSGQTPFDLAQRGGDFSFRELPETLDVRQLKIAQRSSDFDQTGARQDANLVFPIDRFRELVERGEIAALNHRHFSFMGSISAPGRLMAESAPRVAEMLCKDSVDAAFLVPA